jgi:DNA protecting protein DprA
VLGPQDEFFPTKFDALKDPPYWLFVDGNPVVLNQPPLMAVVGTREASHAGKKAAQVATFAAAESGFGLVSGLAEGIDAAAHSLAARYSMPQVGVLGTGINVIFPRTTAPLRRAIVETGGAVVSEYLPTENYGKAQFVRRNRLQAAFAAVVAPIEGAVSSGTAHTLRFAQELDKPIIGVRHGASSESNEILELVRKLGFPMFDLSRTEDRERLRLLLQSLPGQRWTGFRRPDPSILYRRVRMAWQDMTDFIEPTEEEKIELVRQFVSDLGLNEYTLVKRDDG